MGDGSDDWGGLATFYFYTPNLLANFNPKNPMEWGMAFWGALNSKGLCR